MVASNSSADGDGRLPHERRFGRAAAYDGDADTQAYGPQSKPGGMEITAVTKCRLYSSTALAVHSCVTFALYFMGQPPTRHRHPHRSPLQHHLPGPRSGPGVPPCRAGQTASSIGQPNSGSAWRDPIGPYRGPTSRLTARRPAQHSGPRERADADGGRLSPPISGPALTQSFPNLGE